eukprot:2372298-Prymnesium_polylepis.2
MPKSPSLSTLQRCGRARTRGSEQRRRRRRRLLLLLQASSRGSGCLGDGGCCCGGWWWWWWWWRRRCGKQVVVAAAAAAASRGSGGLRSPKRGRLESHGSPPLVREEEVLRLEVTVQHALCVHVLHGEAELDKVVEHLALGQQLAVARLEQAVQIAALGVVHHDVEHARLDERVAVRDDIGMVEAGQEAHLLHGLIALLGFYPRDIHQLHHVLPFAVLLVLDELRRAEGSLADLLDLDVVVHLRDNCVAATVAVEQGTVGVATPPAHLSLRPTLHQRRTAAWWIHKAAAALGDLGLGRCRVLLHGTC